MKVCNFFISPLLLISTFASAEKLKQDSVWYHYPGVSVTANRYEKDVFETHLPVRVIHEDQIWQDGASNLSATLSGQAGVDVMHSGPWSEKVVIRGLTGHNLILVDGLRLDVLRDYGSHAPLLDVDQIERIEIIRGPASVQYGSDAVAGVVNIITQKFLAHPAVWAVQVSAGMDYASANRQFSQNATLSAKYHQWQWTSRLSNRKAEDLRTPAGTLNNTAYSGYEINSKLKYVFSTHHHFTLAGHLNRTDEAGVPINQFAQRARFLKYDRDRITADYVVQNHDLAQLNVRSSFYMQQEERNFDAYLYHVPQGANSVNNLLNANRYVNTQGGFVQASFMPFKRNLVTAGFDGYMESDNTRRLSDAVVTDSYGQVLMDPPPDLTPPTPKSDRKGLGVFLEDEWTPVPNLTLNTGIRADQVLSRADGTAGTLVEKSLAKTDRDYCGHIGAVVRLKDGLRFTANLGRAFKVPTLQQRFFKGAAQVGFLTGDPELRSEISLNIDLGLKWETRLTSGEISVFRNRVHDFIVMNPVDVEAGKYVYANVGLAELVGGEVQGLVRLTRAFSVSVSGAYVCGEDVRLNRPLPQIAPLKGTIGLRYEAPANQCWVEASSIFVADQNRNAENELRTPGYGLLNFSTGLHLNALLPLHYPVYLTLNGRNLLDRSYRDHLSTVTWWDAAGQDFVMGLRIQF